MNTSKYTIEQQIDAVKREINMRRRVYPRWVQLKKMSSERADFELNCMSEVLHTLQLLKFNQEKERSLFPN